MAAKKSDEERPTLRFLMIGAEKIDLLKATPVTVGDTVALERQDVRILNQNLDGSAEKRLQFVSHFVRKIKSSATDEEINAIPLVHLGRAMFFILGTLGDVPDPN